MFSKDGQKQQNYKRDHVDVLAVSSTSTDQRQQMLDRHIMWSADVAALSVDGWQPNEDAVVMRSQRLVTNVLPDTVEQCRPGIGASSYTVCTRCAQARQANEGQHVVARHVSPAMTTDVQPVSQPCYRNCSGTLSSSVESVAEY